MAPIYCYEAEACTGFEVKILADSYEFTDQCGTGDLAEGARGDYRYIVPLRGEGSKVTKIWWSESQGDNRTGDINKGRRGDYLYFCWGFN